MWWAVDMTDENPTSSGRVTEADGNSVELPRPTAWPLVLSLGVALAAAGVVTGSAFFLVGGVVFAVGLAGWVSELLPGMGHVHEPLAEPALRPQPVTGAARTVEQLRPGQPGYRLRLPEQVHPISAGVKGSIVGGVAMVVPALLWGVLSGHGVWYPINLLTGMVLPGIGDMTVAELEQLRPALLLVAGVIHAAMSVVFGLIYGVLLPTLPDLPKPFAWGGLLMPLLWTAVSFGLMSTINPVLDAAVSWPWFIASQFVFGIVAAAVVEARSNRWSPVLAGLVGGLVGGVVMSIPALLWGLLKGHGIWYPVNLLAGMVWPGLGAMADEELHHLHTDWLLAATAVHIALSAAFGVVYGLILPRLRPIPAPMVWGGLLMPLVWTGVGYGLMGVVNPVLQQRVDWPWFISSQFVFGVVAAVVVVRSETVHIPPAGRGLDRVSDFVTGEGGVSP
jgi:hypothetical protein